MFHYVYKIHYEDYEESFYIGVRSCKCKPEDDPYKGSGNHCLYFARSLKSTKEIISRHETREEAECEESRLIAECFGNVLCKNRKRTRALKYGYV